MLQVGNYLVGEDNVMAIERFSILFQSTFFTLDMLRLQSGCLPNGWCAAHLSAKPGIFTRNTLTTDVFFRLFYLR